MGCAGVNGCWYVAADTETDAIRAALRKIGVDVRAENARGALKLVCADAAYIVHGAFDPEATIQIFNDAIEQSYTDGFSGFRAAAEMSWALSGEEGAHRLIVYEALLKSLFANCRAIGLCLYDRKRMPLAVINGALATHPVAGSKGQYAVNPFYDSTVKRLPTAKDADVRTKLRYLASQANPR
jgi:chemotaxis family two-component system sensor kinase Cph1